MRKREIGWIVVLLLVIGAYIHYFSHWGEKKEIQIFASIRQLPRRTGNLSTMPVIFTLDQTYRLTSIKVTAVDSQHTNATEQCFVEARGRFDAQLFRESVPHLKELEQALRDHDAALSMGVDVVLGTHTVTVFADGPQIFVRDTARRGFHAISGLQDIGKLVDSVLCVAK